MQIEKPGSLLTPAEKFFAQLPTSGDVIVRRIPRVNTDDYRHLQFERQLRYAPTSPDLNGIFLPPGEWGFTDLVGPCTFTIITGLAQRYIWFNHLLPDEALQDMDVTKISQMTPNNEVDLWLMGACPNRAGYADPNFREGKIQQITRQFMQLGIEITTHAYWNPVSNSWLGGYVLNEGTRANVELWL